MKRSRNDFNSAEEPERNTAMVYGQPTAVKRGKKHEFLPNVNVFRFELIKTID